MTGFHDSWRRASETDGSLVAPDRPRRAMMNPRGGSLYAVVSAAVLILALAPPSAEGAIPAQVQAAAEKGLDYLAKTQLPDGTWPDQYGKSPAVVGLVAMAFMAHGDEPGRGKYRDVLDRAIDYILNNAKASGLISREGSQPMYDHGFAALALAEAYGMSKSEGLERALLMAVRLIERVQNPQGGWRYQPRPADADITVTGCQLMALRAARNAGVNVQSEVVRRGLEYVKACACSDGGFAYQPGGGSGKARTGIGVLLLQVLGEPDSPLVASGADYLLRNLPQAGETYFYYGLYYCSQAMFQKGGEHWKTWREKMLEALLPIQIEDGSWPERGDPGGKTYSTAMAILALEVEWRLLPIFQR